MTRVLRILSRPIRTARRPGSRSVGYLAAIKQRWNGRLVLAEEVEDALEHGRPIVALESTIITHGMPHPTNLETARSVESIIRSHSAVPATVALIDGHVHVGLTDSQLAELADPSGHKDAVKASRRDLAPVLAMRKTGGTTVAGTMYVASQVGIDVFVTGGIGGVHRRAESSELPYMVETGAEDPKRHGHFCRLDRAGPDCKSRLRQPDSPGADGRKPVAVVCAGAKSILDIPRTLEVLETQGVCVATYGPTTDFPAFYHPRSGLKSPWNVDTPQTAAALIHTALTLPTPLSTLLAVPIPAEHTDKGAQVQEAVEQAVRESVEQGIDKRGKEVTPWLLKRVGELSGGLALQLNVKLIENNAHVGARVATHVATLRQRSSPGLRTNTSRPSTDHRRRFSSSARNPNLPPPDVIVFGSAAIDVTSIPSSPVVPRTTTPGRISITPGGVGRNIAEAAQRLLPPHSVQLVSVVGAAGPGQPPDPLQQVLLGEMANANLRTDGLIAMPGRTAACTLSFGADNDLVAGIADMDIIEKLDDDIVTKILRDQTPKMVVFDCNLKMSALEVILRACVERRIPTFCDPTSIEKSGRVIQGLESIGSGRARAATRALSHLAPNDLELRAMWTSLTGRGHSSETGSSMGGYQLEELASELLIHVDNLWVKCGARGTYHIYRDSNSRITSRHLPPGSVLPSDIVSTTGAGDTLSGGLVAALVAEEGRFTSAWEERVMSQVVRTLKSPRAVG